MEFVVQEAAKKVLDGELVRARQLRQKQVRQQASQWSEERTRRFEQEKIRQKQEMASQVTEQVQQYAKARIEHLLTAHDLAIAEVGSAHRAAAKLREAEAERKQRAEELKVAAEERGKAAKRRMLDARKSQAYIRSEGVRRREEVRKEEDRKAKEKIEVAKSKKEMAEVTKSKKEMAEATKPKKEMMGAAKPKPIGDRGGSSSAPVRPSVKKPLGFREAVKVHSGRNSPNAFNKADDLRKLSLQRVEEKAKRQEELFRRAEERGKIALRKAALERKLLNLNTQLLSGVEGEAQSVMGTGSCKITFKKATVERKLPNLDTQLLSGVGEAQSAMGTERLDTDPHLPPPRTDEQFSEISDSDMESDTEKDDAWNMAEDTRKLSLQRVEEKAKRRKELPRGKDRGKITSKETTLEGKLSNLNNQLLSGVGGEPQSAMGTERLDTDPRLPPRTDELFVEMSDSDIESDSDDDAVEARNEEEDVRKLFLERVEEKAKRQKELPRGKDKGTDPDPRLPPPRTDEQFSEISDSDISGIEPEEKTPKQKQKKFEPGKSKPDGPYTSTPDGEMMLKRPSPTSSRNVAVTASRKDLMLHAIVSGFLTRRIESIELLPVSSSSSSDLHVDSTLITRSPTSGSSSTFQSPLGTSSSHHTSSDKTTTPSSSSIRPPSRKNTLQDLLLVRSIPASTSDTEGEPKQNGNGSSKPKSNSSADRIKNHDKILNTSSSLGITTHSEKGSSEVATSNTNNAITGSSSSAPTDSSNGGGGGTTRSGTDSSAKSGSTYAEATVRTTFLGSSTSRSSRSNSATTTTTTTTDKANTSSSAPTSSPNNTKRAKKEVKRSAIRDLVGPEMTDSTEFLSPICPRPFRPGTAGDRHESPSPLYSNTNAAAGRRQEDIVTSIFDQLQYDFAGLMSIERPPWSYSVDRIRSPQANI